MCKAKRLGIKRRAYFLSRSKQFLAGLLRAVLSQLSSLKEARGFALGVFKRADRAGFFRQRLTRDDSHFINCTLAAP